MDNYNLEYIFDKVIGLDFINSDCVHNNEWPTGIRRMWLEDFCDLLDEEHDDEMEFVSIESVKQHYTKDEWSRKMRNVAIKKIVDRTNLCMSVMKNLDIDVDDCIGQYECLSVKKRFETKELHKNELEQALSTCIPTQIENMDWN